MGDLICAMAVSRMVGLSAIAVLVCIQAVDPIESSDVVHLHSTEQQRAVHELEHLLRRDQDKAKSVSFTYHQNQKDNLGEDSHKAPASAKQGPADGLIEM